MKKIKLVFASDSFKGSLTTKKINEILTESAREVFSKAELVCLPISDGGEGAVDTIVEFKNGSFINVKVNNPLFEEITAKYGVFEDTAVISMSEASGLTLIEEDRRNPLKTTTFGTGELILDAVEKGYKKIIITIGGSATNDGGMGALTALGAKFTLKDGKLAKGVGEELELVESVDFSALEKYSGIDFTVLCDVTNPLTGEKGASKVFAKQKGATEGIIERLELGMINYENVVFSSLNTQKTEIVGGGAAGGLGFALKVGLNAKMKSGIDYVLDLAEFDKKIKNATAIITGEGRIDSQSVDGKVISGILSRAKKRDVPVFAIVGSVGDGAEKAYQKGINGIYSIIDKPSSLDIILENSETLYKKTAISLFNTIKSIIK